MLLLRQVHKNMELLLLNRSTGIQLINWQWWQLIDGEAGIDTHTEEQVDRKRERIVFISVPLFIIFNDPLWFVVCSFGLPNSAFCVESRSIKCCSLLLLTFLCQSRESSQMTLMLSGPCYPLSSHTRGSTQPVSLSAHHSIILCTEGIWSLRHPAWRLQWAELGGDTADGPLTRHTQR